MGHMAESQKCNSVFGAATVAALWVALASSATQASVINVPSPEAPTIQEAINAASDGDEIIVAPGTYFEAINFLGKAISAYGRPR
jgi:hypothetical protein